MSFVVVSEYTLICKNIFQYTTATTADFDDADDFHQKVHWTCIVKHFKKIYVHFLIFIFLRMFEIFHNIFGHDDVLSTLIAIEILLSGCPSPFAWLIAMMLSRIYRLWPAKSRIRSPINIFVARGNREVDHFFLFSSHPFSQASPTHSTGVPCSRFNFRTKGTHPMISMLINLSAFI